MTRDLKTLPGVRMLISAEPCPGAKLDESLIRMVAGGERVLARIAPSALLYVPICGEKSRGDVGDLLLGQASEEGYSIHIECQASLEERSSLGDIEANAVDGMGDVPPLCFMDIRYGSEELRCQLDGGDGADQKPVLMIGRENTNTALMANDGRGQAVGKLGDHCGSCRGESAQPTIAPGGSATSPVLNNRCRSAGGN